ncbi:hypothetical protein RFI_34555 [Reticulomyxa filosa]|uniref:Uncharacterized protein n=1 Tax=Reticulomyxa filosa TaxID=46433 RepID=X6LNB3_RETFI|nr:hypothetical protein RFI_34555 [Reticulomyxa filosa]|eukprot:ETO02856.1 hypothetical protein RFI_34555 [Reticulomyxa filosa]
MLNYVSKHYSTNIQQAHVLKSSILPFHAFVKELGAILLSKQLELQQLPTSVSSIILFIKARDVIGLIELPNPNDKPSQSLYPIEQLQKWNKLKMIQIKMLQKLKWEFFGRSLLLYSNKENIRTLRAKEIMDCFTCKKSDDKLMRLNTLTDKQISHDRSSQKH